MDMNDDHDMPRGGGHSSSDKVKGDEKHSKLSDNSNWEGHGESGGIGAAHHTYHAGWEQDIGRLSLRVINSNPVANLGRGVAVLARPP